MGTVSRGFRGRRRPAAELPPGQYLVEDFPYGDPWREQRYWGDEGWRQR